FSLLTQVKAQTRIATATGIFLDIAARDFTGSPIARRLGETDAAFSARLSSCLLIPRATRSGIIQAISNLTGRKPIVFEPRNIIDTGGYNLNIGYGSIGAYGSFNMPYQYMVTAYRPNNLPERNAGGYNSGPGGYNVPPFFYSAGNGAAGAVSDADIYTAI